MILRPFDVSHSASALSSRVLTLSAWVPGHPQPEGESHCQPGLSGVHSGTLTGEGTERGPSLDSFVPWFWFPGGLLSRCPPLFPAFHTLHSQVRGAPFRAPASSSGQPFVTYACREDLICAVPSLQRPLVRQMLAEDPSAALRSTLWPWVLLQPCALGWRRVPLAQALPFPASPSLRYSECHSALSMSAQGFLGYFKKHIALTICTTHLWVNHDRPKVSPPDCAVWCGTASGVAVRGRGEGDSHVSSSLGQTERARNSTRCHSPGCAVRWPVPRALPQAVGFSTGSASIGLGQLLDFTE